MADARFRDPPRTRPAASRSGGPCARRFAALIGIIVALLAPLGSLPSACAQDGEIELGARDDGRPGEDRKILITHLRPKGGLLDADTVEVWQARLERWLADDAKIKFVIVRLNARGTAEGDIDPIRDAIKAIRGIRRLAPGARTIAYVDVDEQASNAASAIALACDDLVMGQGSSIGHLADREAAVPDARENDAKTARGLLAEQAALDDDVPTALAESFVSKFHETVYWVTYTGVDGPRKLRSESVLEIEREDPKIGLKIDATEVVVKEGATLGLSSSDAKKFGLCKTVLQSAFDPRLEEFRLKRELLDVQPENIIDAERGAIESSTPGGRGFVNFLNHPVTRFVLLLAAFLGLVLEFQMPGTFVPIACASVAFLLFFVGGLFPAFDVTGVNVPTTTAFEIVLFVVGMGLVVTEIFLLPGVLVFGLLGFVFIFVSLVMAMTPPAGLTSPATMTFKDSLMVLVFALAAGFGAFFALLRVLPRSSLFSRSGLVTNASVTGVANADNIVEVQERNMALIGRTGRAITSLRPAGKIELDGRELDVVAEGGAFIDNGEEVEIIEADVMRAVVRRKTSGP